MSSGEFSDSELSEICEKILKSNDFVQLVEFPFKAKRMGIPMCVIKEYSSNVFNKIYHSKLEYIDEFPDVIKKPILKAYPLNFISKYIELYSDENEDINITDKIYEHYKPEDILGFLVFDCSHPDFKYFDYMVYSYLNEEDIRRYAKNIARKINKIYSSIKNKKEKDAYFIKLRNHIIHVGYYNSKHVFIYNELYKTMGEINPAIHRKMIPSMENDSYAKKKFMDKLYELRLAEIL
jgi:hypothetical protein